MDELSSARQIGRVQFKNFRCFDILELNFESPISIIEGANGSGKTSVLEALHYLCYLRSFRTHSPSELLTFDAPSFFIKAELLAEHTTGELQVGFAGKRRLVKINQKPIQSYKELIDYYRAVTLTEDDLGLIKDGPEVRRSFCDQVLIFHDPGMISVLKQLKNVVEQRNALLRRSYNQELYEMLSEQLWDVTSQLQQARIAQLSLLEKAVNTLIMEFFTQEYEISFSYVPKKSTDAPQEFDDFIKQICPDERRFGRSLFGAHLDDFSITLSNRLSRTFASRGQQKLIVLLIKIAHARLLAAQRGPVVLLMDDFMTDFDRNRADTLIQALKTIDGQLIITTPIYDPFLASSLGSKAQRIQLTC